MKRLFDIAASLAGLAALGWLILLLAWLVRRDSQGPGLFVQERVGREGRSFRCYKLRTMRVDTVAAATHDTPKSAVTPLGAKLRRWKLDELPQLWNVLRGDMSFVGPRPCLPIQAEVIEERRKRGVLAIRPGITGLAQVNGIDMSEPARLGETDARYMQSRSFTGDLGLIFRTLAGGGRGDRVAL